MKNLILSLSLVLLSLVSNSQIFTVSSDTSYYFNYSKKESIDDLLLHGSVISNGMSFRESVYEFNFKTDTLTIFQTGREVKKYKIKNPEKRFKSKRLLKCQVVSINGKVADVLVTKNKKTNTVTMRFEYSVDSSTNESFVYFKGKYSIN